MPLQIAGIGTALPTHVIGQSAAAGIARQLCRWGRGDSARLLDRLYERSGVATRGSVLLQDDDGSLASQSFFQPDAADFRGPSTQSRMRAYEQHAPLLATTASAKALAMAEVDAADITHLVTVSCSGFFAPAVDVHLIDQLGIDPGVARTHVGFMGCHGAVNGLRVAQAFSRDPAARVLLCAVELCTLHFQYDGELDLAVANALFADGAAALVAHAADSPSLGSLRRLVATGSRIIPSTQQDMSWRIGDEGFVMSLSRNVPVQIERHLGSFLDEWLGSHGLRRSDIASWAVHPGGPRILQSVETALGLSDDALDASREILRRHGNMSSPTILFILDELRRRNAAGPCVALAFGPGLVVEAALFE